MKNALPTSFLRHNNVTAHASNHQPGSPFWGGVYATTAGTIELITVGNQTVIYTVPSNTTIKGAFVRVLAANTTCTGIVGFN